MNNQRFYKFPRITVVCILCKSIIVYRSILEWAVCLKRLIISVFGSFELLLLLRLMGVLVPPLHIESTGSMIQHPNNYTLHMHVGPVCIVMYT